MTLVECAFAYPLAMLLVIGTIAAGMESFRYQRLAMLAREGARWASVRGPTYQSEHGEPAPTSQSLRIFLKDRMIALDPGRLDCNLQMTDTTVRVTLKYELIPEGLLPTVNLEAESTMPITY